MTAKGLLPLSPQVSLALGNTVVYFLPFCMTSRGLPCWAVNEVPLEDCGWRVVTFILDWIRVYHDFRRVCCLTLMDFSTLICRDLFFMNLQAKNVHVCLRGQVAMRIG